MSAQKKVDEQFLRLSMEHTLILDVIHDPYKMGVQMSQCAATDRIIDFRVYTRGAGAHQ